MANGKRQSYAKLRKSESAALANDLDFGDSPATKVEVWVKSSAAATFTIYGSADADDATRWREIDQIVLTGAGEDHRGFENAYRHVRVSTATANDNEIEIVGAR